MTTAIDFSKYADIVVLTGAGISVASGIPPFRGPGGVWNEADVMAYATAEAQATNPWGVWKFAAPLREALQTLHPNPAHYALAKLEENRQKGQTFTLITQNIDGLHQRAGSKNVLEMHGNVNNTCCTNKKCQLKPFAEVDSHLDALPMCGLCRSPLRLDIVLFDEEISNNIQGNVHRALLNAKIFIAIGTSALVYPSAEFARFAMSYGARTVLVNLEPLEFGSSDFDDVYIGKAEEILPELLGVG